jgi:hypothetical protein
MMKITALDSMVNGCMRSAKASTIGVAPFATDSADWQVPAIEKNSVLVNELMAIHLLGVKM